MHHPVANTSQLNTYFKTLQEYSRIGQAIFNVKTNTTIFITENENQERQGEGVNQMFPGSH
jgi:hypothetical protein